MSIIIAFALTLLPSAQAGVVSVPVRVVAPGLSIAASVSAPLFSPSGLSASFAAPLPAVALPVVALPAVAPVSVKPQAPVVTAAARMSAVRSTSQPRSALNALRRLAAHGGAIGEDAHTASGIKLDHQPKDSELAAAVLTSDRFFFSPGNGLALDADPSKPESIEKALRKIVDSDPKKFGVTNAYGPPSAEMATVHVEFLPGEGAQADSYIAVFRQNKKGVDKDGKPYFLLVDGANLRFDVKILNGKPVLMGWEGGFAPHIDPAVMKQNFTDEELARKAMDRLTLPKFVVKISRPQFRRDPYHSTLVDDRSAAPRWLTRMLTLIEGRWHALDIFQAPTSKDDSVIVAVDVRTGKAWAFGENDFRSLREPTADSTLLGKALARGEALTKDGNDHGPAVAMPLAHAKVYGSNGQVLTITDADGSFTLPGQGAPVPVTIKLDGLYADVTDGNKENQPVVARITVLPGQTVVATLNAHDDEQLTADVNAYVYSHALFDWFKSFLGLKDPRLYKPLAGGIHTNETSMPGNAFYSPDLDGFFLMKKATVKQVVMSELGPVEVSITFENTAQPSIIFHELGHRFIQMASHIALTAAQAVDPAYRFILNPMDAVVGAAPNEAFADMLSMFIRRSPVIGAGFIVDGTEGLDLPGMIRSGENEIMMDLENESQNADPHERGNILMGVAWKVFVGLVSRMGEKGAAYAANLFVRTLLYAQPGNVISALQHVMLADMTKDGRMPNADIILAEARRHGVRLPAPAH